MARIKFGMMMTDARGKLGGQVFTKTRSGAAVRTKVTPTNPQTSFQGNIRSLFGNFSQAWNALTEEDRLTWQNAVAEYQRTNVFGDQYKLSGKNLFMSINQNLSTIGVAQTDVVPDIKTTAGVSLTSATVGIGVAEIAIVLDVLGDFSTGSKIVFEATPPLSPGKYNFSGSYRQFFTSLATGGAPDEGDLYTAYVAKFGNPAPGKKISFRAYIIDAISGLASPRSTVDAIATP